MYVEPRPYAKEFLKAVSQIFTVYIYTAGRKRYADKVLDHLDEEKTLIDKRFYRDSCIKLNGNVIKDLRHLKRASKSKSEMILVDDNEHSINHNYPFAVKVKAF